MKYSSVIIKGNIFLLLNNVQVVSKIERFHVVRGNKIDFLRKNSTWIDYSLLITDQSWHYLEVIIYYPFVFAIYF